MRQRRKSSRLAPEERRYRFDFGQAVCVGLLRFFGAWCNRCVPDRAFPNEIALLLRQLEYGAQRTLDVLQGSATQAARHGNIVQPFLDVVGANVFHPSARTTGLQVQCPDVPVFLQGGRSHVLFGSREVDSLDEIPQLDNVLGPVLRTVYGRNQLLGLLCNRRWWIFPSSSSANCLHTRRRFTSPSITRLS